MALIAVELHLIVFMKTSINYIRPLVIFIPSHVQVKPSLCKLKYNEDKWIACSKHNFIDSFSIMAHVIYRFITALIIFSQK